MEMFKQNKQNMSVLTTAPLHGQNVTFCNTLHGKQTLGQYVVIDVMGNNGTSTRKGKGCSLQF